jgi:hypothetical protein
MNGAAASCQACGAQGQACCGRGGGGAACQTGLSCMAMAGGADAGVATSCEPCGAAGQPCCGAGLITQRTCNTNLACRAPDGGGAPSCQ